MIKITLLNPSAKMPTRGSELAAGYDLYTVAPVCLEKGRVTLVSFGIATEFAPDVVGIIKDRSSLAKMGIHVFGGVIDADYRGEIKGALYNSGDFDICFAPGERIAQLVFLGAHHNVIEHSGTASETVRGAGGFGSTGK